MKTKMIQALPTAFLEALLTAYENHDPRHQDMQRIRTVITTRRALSDQTAEEQRRHRGGK